MVSDGRSTPLVADNHLCLDTGLLFNSAGTRGGEIDFYEDEYVLHAESLEAEFMHFDGDKAIGLYDNILSFIRAGAAGVSLAEKGRVLDIGCGKGMLLNRFRRHFGAWDLHAVEPSKSATSFFAKVMPELSVFEGAFEMSPFAQQTFDFVMANGVLEHVPQPVDFLKGFAACMAPGGLGFIGVPNLKANPCDLLTFDHLSKLTPNVTHDLFRAAGLRVVAEAVPDTRVPMWFLLRKDAAVSSDAPRTVLAEEEQIALRARDYVEKSFLACDAAAKAARADGKPLAFFGSGLIGVAANDHTSLRLQEVACIFEDNSSLWGKTRFGLPVRPSGELADAKIGHLVISTNPCYYPAIKRRIAEVTGANSPTIYLAQGH
jgi:2-polyprenyl-3-methyl-5-hydroxy-6-metoxy-1,4-benzoquinol methylase